MIAANAVGLVVAGVIGGQLITGIPLSLALSRQARRRPLPRDFETDQALIDLELLDWPVDDPAAAMLDTWRRERETKRAPAVPYEVRAVRLPHSLDAWAPGSPPPSPDEIPSSWVPRSWLGRRP